jgi:hypothetical protein
MVHVEPPPPVIPTPEPEIEPVVVLDVPDELPEFDLHAVMTAPNADKALIDGRVYVVGQTVDDTEWLVTGIDVTRRRVTLKNLDTAAEIVISVPRPR